MLELAILGLLKEQELHGYELKKRLAETVGSGISFGSLYPALGRLTADGALRVVVGAPSKSETRSSRGKKVYGITERGEQLFDELLAADTATSEDERSFNLRLAFARHLTRDARIGMMERRRAFLQERLARARVTIRTGWGRFDAYTRSLMEHGNETTERDISWLDRLIERERADSRPLPPKDVAPTDAADPARDELAAVALASWAASTAPTMPARPVVRPGARAIPATQVNHGPAAPAPVNHGPAAPAPVNEGPAVTPPTNKQPAPPARQRGGNIS